MDRFDCQLLMATFVHVYQSSFIKLVISGSTVSLLSPLSHKLLSSLPHKLSFFLLLKISFLLHKFFSISFKLSSSHINSPPFLSALPSSFPNPHTLPPLNSQSCSSTTLAPAHPRLEARRSIADISQSQRYTNQRRLLAVNVI